MESRWDHTQEQVIYQSWEKAGAFAPKGNKPYTILMPPPNANASLHAGHGMYTVDDVLVRFKRMQGFAALWIPGLDHAGFETQFVYEKHLTKEGKSRFNFDRQTLYDNIAKFVKQNSGLIYEQFKRLGFSADWSRSVFTLDKQVTDQVFATFQQMAKDGLVYRSDYLVNYCTHDGTSLAELEIKHEERVDPLYYLKYGPLTVATVRPETMFGDVAVAVHPKDGRYTDLVGTEIALPLTNRKIKVIADEMVDVEFGSGAVKITPAHDPNDFETGRRHGLPTVQVIDQTGRLRLPEDVTFREIDGQKVKAAREKVVEELRKQGVLEKVDENYQHAVTVCYKCGRDLEPMIIPNWFVKVDPLKKPVIKAVSAKKTQFHPHRFERHLLTWLSVMHDWPISRQIAWGIRIPVWYDPKANPDLVVTFLDKTKKSVTGRVGQLLSEENFDFAQIQSGLQTLSAPKDATFVISQTKPSGDYLQETDTFDTWFSSGQWPLVTLQEGEFADRFPTDVLGTLSDILKFWVSRMMMFSLYQKGDVPFKHVYLWSMVADSKGLKMSKSKGNVINPIELVDKYGADAFRMSLLFGTGQGSKVILSEQKVKAMRNFANKIWNAARFIKMMKLDESIGSEPSAEETKYLEKLTGVAREITKHLDELKLGLAAEATYEYFWHWYCDVCIEQGKAGQLSSEALTQGLETFLKLLHPFVPFVTEAVWKELGHEELLATSSWPVAGENIQE